MKHCPECEFTFDDQQQVCDFDGTELSVVPEKLPSFKNVSSVPAASGSFLGRLVKSRAALSVLALTGVALSALLIGYYDSVNQRDIDISKPQIQSDTVSTDIRETVWSAPAERSGDGALGSLLARHIQSGVALRLPPHSKQLSVKSTRVDKVEQLETPSDRPRVISTQRKIGTDELPPSMVKRLLGGSHSRSVRSRRGPSRSSLLATKRKAEHANRQSRARNQARPDSRERVRQQHSAGWVANRRAVVTNNESTPRRKDSKVVAILKKTGKILKRPFEFIAGR